MNDRAPTGQPGISCVVAGKPGIGRAVADEPGTNGPDHGGQCAITKGFAHTGKDAA
ncbi:hypothetical protein GCM10027089_51420 [Nocardia thraciensis]